MVCIKCNSEFPNWLTIDGKKRNLKNRTHCLSCSPFGSRNTKKHVDQTPGGRKKIEGTYKYVKARRKRIKAQAVEYLGSKCAICHYDRCAEALDFHHLESSEKDFTISDSSSKSWENIQRELDKCILLCANCHREIHAGFTVV